MPETVNGYANGNGHMGFEMEDNSSFLFTSESVGEGHPGKFYKVIKKIIKKKKGTGGTLGDFSDEKLST